MSWVDDLSDSELRARLLQHEPDSEEKVDWLVTHRQDEVVSELILDVLK